MILENLTFLSKIFNKIQNSKKKYLLILRQSGPRFVDFSVIIVDRPDIDEIVENDARALEKKRVRIIFDRLIIFVEK